MDANLRFQIPFTLLGRKDVLDPNTHSPIQIVHAALREFCPTIPIHFSPSPTSTLPETAWILHTPPTPPQSHLTLDEKAKLGRHVWSYPMVLQYNGITHFTSADAWTHFRSEAASIFDVLVRAFHDLRAPIGAKGVQGRMWSLVATESDLLRVSVVPGRMEDGRQGVFDGEVVRKMMMVFACVERELVQLCCPGVVLEYWMVSRFMELRG
ncbi:hypothetical protein GQ44DRAFT_132689 [Phaeosphaeriaceae sp. PMI808]|nr:hypothetical protein GQ44DRAFT_132689 [Phaeosphaeriaceae sp. PMI808]